MLDTPKTDAEIMEPPKQTMPQEPPAPPARPQGQPPVAPSPSAAPASPAAQTVQTAAAPEPKPDLVTISYNGKDFKVTPDVAEMWKHRQSAFDTGFKEKAERVKELEQQVAPVRKPAEPTEEERREALATRLLTEPDRVFAEIKEEVKKELTEAYRGDITAREFQANWWSRNTELLPHREIFDAMLLSKAQMYMKEGLSDAQAYDRNAEALRKFILGIRGSASQAQTPITQHVEEPAPPSGVPPVSEPAGEPFAKTLSESLLERQRRKAEAALRPAAPARGSSAA